MNGRKIFLASMAVIEWFALIAQLLLHFQSVELDTGEATIRFFSFFTILTNILVAVYVTKMWLAGRNRQSDSLSRPATATAITLYILVVGLIYNLLLRQLWDSEGLQAIVHDLLHTVIPVLMFVYWWRYVNAKAVTYSAVPSWLLYPFIYAAVVLFLGHFSYWYPYPFLDAAKFGYGQIAVNSVILLIVFLLFGYGLVLIGKKKEGVSKRNSTK